MLGDSVQDMCRVTAAAPVPADRRNKTGPLSVHVVAAGVPPRTAVCIARRAVRCLGHCGGCLAAMGRAHCLPGPGLCLTFLRGALKLDQAPHLQARSQNPT